jgi:hypothetical protein
MNDDDRRRSIQERWSRSGIASLAHPASRCDQSEQGLQQHRQTSHRKAGRQPGEPPDVEDGESTDPLLDVHDALPCCLHKEDERGGAESTRATRPGPGVVTTPARPGPGVVDAPRTGGCYATAPRTRAPDRGLLGPRPGPGVARPGPGVVTADRAPDRAPDPRRRGPGVVTADRAPDRGLFAPDRVPRCPRPGGCFPQPAAKHDRRQGMRPRRVSTDRQRRMIEPDPSTARPPS